MLNWLWIKLGLKCSYCKGTGWKKFGCGRDLGDCHVASVEEHCECPAGQLAKERDRKKREERIAKWKARGNGGMSDV